MTGMTKILAVTLASVLFLPDVLFADTGLAVALGPRFSS
jgi:hypothetical protein